MTQYHPPALEHVARLHVSTRCRALGPKAEAIVADIAKRRGVTIKELKSDDRHKRVAHPRQEAMHALYATARYSLPAIGAYFGRDHTTVLHGIRAHAVRIGAVESAPGIAAHKRRAGIA